MPSWVTEYTESCSTPSLIIRLLLTFFSGTNGLAEEDNIYYNLSFYFFVLVPFWKCFDLAPYSVSSHLLERQIWHKWSKLWKELLVNFLQLHVVQMFFFSLRFLAIFLAKNCFKWRERPWFLERYRVENRKVLKDRTLHTKINKSVKGQPTAL